MSRFLASLDLSKKSVLNYHIGLSALWTWAVREGISSEHVVRKVDRPKPEKRQISPYSHEDLRAMLDSLTESKLYSRPGKKESAHSLPLPERNRAIILLLVDTGLRASELCSLRIVDLDLKNQRVKVMGKGSKKRAVPFSARTAQAIWRYLKTRPDERSNRPAFIALTGNDMDRDRLLKSLMAIGKRAGVKGVNVHRFRHTFAINYLRNGGDPYSLQMMLGHATMDMVKNYLALAQADLDVMHRLASPVDHWRL